MFGKGKSGGAKVRTGERVPERFTRYRPEMPVYPTVESAMEDLQAASSNTLFSPELSALVKRSIRVAARADAAAGAVGIQEDGLAWSAWITNRRRMCVEDINQNIRRHYARTMPVVARILSLARELADAEAAGDRGAEREVDDAQISTWDRPDAGRARAAAAERARALEDARSELDGYLSVYRSALVLLEREASTCRAEYQAYASTYMLEAIRLSRPRLFGLVRGNGLAFSPGAVRDLHFPEVKITMPDDVFAGMSPADVVANAYALSLPAPYGVAMYDEVTRAA